VAAFQVGGSQRSKTARALDPRGAHPLGFSRPTRGILLTAQTMALPNFLASVQFQKGVEFLFNVGIQPCPSSGEGGPPQADAKPHRSTGRSEK
jgi:hypothetical protein